jgi:uncharacterized protein
MGLLRHWISGGVWPIFALVLWGSPIKAAEMPGERVVEPSPSLARAYRKLGDLYRDGNLERQKAGHVQEFLDSARRASPKTVVISVIDPSRIFGDPDQAPSDGARAVLSYEVAGELGDPEALVRLGDLYRQGSIVPKDLRAALAFFRMARDRGYAGARWRLAEMMLRGEGLPVDSKEARAELEIAAAAGVSTAMLMLGDLAASGEAGPIDAEAAVSHWQRAADAGEVRGLVRLASLYYDGLIVPRDSAKAYRFFEEAGAKGDSYAAVRTAQMLLAGDGVAADRAGGLARLEALAATAGADGKVALADFYSTRDQAGDRFDPARAYSLYVSAAEQGSRSARLRMAVMQVFGEGTTANLDGGLSILRGMVADGDGSAAFSLGELFTSRKAGLADPLAAIAAYEQADKLGDLRAATRLGDIFASGNLVPREPGKALEYYRSAAERGDVLARLKADELVVRGTGTPQEARTALTDIERLAATGLIDAIVLIGDLGRTGVAGLVPVDEKAALASYLLAADKGSRTAALRAGEILISGLPANLDPARGVSMMLSVAEAGDASAYLALGDALLKAGSGYSSGSISPVEAFEKAGTGGMSTAYLRLGDIYRDGVGVPVDGGKAAQYYMKAAGLDLPGDGNDGQ